MGTKHGGSRGRFVNHVRLSWHTSKDSTGMFVSSNNTQKGSRLIQGGEFQEDDPTT